MRIEIPGHEPFDIETVILDLNGTLTNHGKMIKGVKTRIQKLREQALKLFLFSGDTQGTAAAIAKDLEIEFRLTPSADAKADEAKKLGPETAATIGNGQIDVKLFQTVRLRLAVIQKEGAHPLALLNSDAIYTSVNDALDALLLPKSLIATMRR